jgi:NAD-reducing hydrogenase small subunit
MSHTNKNEILSHELPTTPLDPKIQAERDAKIQVAMIALCGCWGCYAVFP